MKPQTTGFLATECSSCDGTGDIVVKRGLEQLPWRYDCDDCRSTGWVIHSDTPAISVSGVLNIIDERSGGGAIGGEFKQGWVAAKNHIKSHVEGAFEEAR